MWVLKIKMTLVTNIFLLDSASLDKSDCHVSWICLILSCLPEKKMAPHSSTLAWKIPWTEEPGRLQSMGSQRVGHDWATSLSCIGKGNGNPPQCSCLENPGDGEAWWAAVSGVTQSRTWLKRLSSSSSSSSPAFIHTVSATWRIHPPLLVRIYPWLRSVSGAVYFVFIATCMCLLSGGSMVGKWQCRLRSQAARVHFTCIEWWWC